MINHDMTTTIYSVDTIHLIDGTNLTTLIKQYPNPGRLITIDDAKQLITALAEYVKRVTEDDVNAYNDYVAESIQKEVNENKPSVTFKQKPQKHVYLFYSKPLDKYKIGIAKDVNERVKGFVQDEAVIITYSRLLDDAWNQEHSLHEMYKEFSCGSEWFKFPTNKLVEEVKNKITNL